MRAASLSFLCAALACGGRTGLDVQQTGRAGSADGGGEPRPSCRFELSEPLVFRAGEGPRAIATADLDGDGALDLVVANTNTDRINVLTNLGGREFSSPTSWAVVQPTALTLADLDADGFPEIIAGDGNLCQLSVLGNSRDGRFPNVTTYPSGCYPQGLVAADFDADGRLDVATADNTSATLSVLFNRGGGELAPLVAHDFGSRPSSLATADLDRDGFPDLVATSWGFLPMKSSAPIIGVFHNDGGGGFELRQRLDVGGTPNVVTTGDFDGDGSIDLALGHEFESSLTVYLSDGGRFDEAAKYPTGLSPAALGSADFDADGRLDVVTADGGSSELSVLRGAGAGRFEPRDAYPAVGSPASLALGDFDADGWLDVAVSGFAVGAVGVFFGGCR